MRAVAVGAVGLVDEHAVFFRRPSASVPKEVAELRWWEGTYKRGREGGSESSHPCQIDRKQLEREYSSPVAEEMAEQRWWEGTHTRGSRGGRADRKQ